MGGLAGKLFGSDDDSAQDAQIAANKAAQRFIEQQAELARGDALSLFPQAIDASRAGFDQALQVMNAALPQQLAAFQGGNLAAQGTLLSGIDPFRQALLTGQADMSAMQPFRANVDMSQILNRNIEEMLGKRGTAANMMPTSGGTGSRLPGLLSQLGIDPNALFGGQAVGIDAAMGRGRDLVGLLSNLDTAQNLALDAVRRTG